MVETFYFEFFFHVNDKKDVDVKCPQSMRCIICYSNLFLFLNFKTQAKKGLIIHNTTNGIIILKNHVNANHSIIVKIFEEELNTPLKGKMEKQLAKKIKKIKLNICMFTNFFSRIEVYNNEF
jgi:hypothetical protein